MKKDINQLAVRMAISCIYDTYVEDMKAAEARGLAIQALAVFAEFVEVDVPNLIKEIEAKPHSKRRRESPLWRRGAVPEPEDPEEGSSD